MMQLAYIRHVDTIPSTLRHVQPTRHVQQRPFARSSLCWHRPHRLHSLSRESALVCRATSAPDELVVLPVFTGSSILLPTGNGVLRAYEKRYTDLFRSFQRQLEVDSSDPPRFLHLISPATAPPAMVFDSPIKDFPNVGCCAYVENVESLEDGSLIVRYRGHRRVLLHLIEEKSNEEEFISTSLSDDEKLQIAAGVWYDDDEEILQENDAVAGLAALERDVAAVIKEIVRLTRITDPSNSNIPEAVLKYAPPAPGRTGRPTSYDALKASGHKAASAIDMWRRHGSVYSNKIGNEDTQKTYADPYTDISERLGRSRRQELFSFAVCSLLMLGTPEMAALLLSRDTAGRLQYALEAARPYLQQLMAAASLKMAIDEGSGGRRNSF